MGMNADGLLFYGYVWEEEGEGPFSVDYDDDDDDDPSSAYYDDGVIERLTRASHPNPWDNFPEAEKRSMPYHEGEAFAEQWISQHAAEIDAWYAAKKLVEADVNPEGRISAGSHGYHETPYGHMFISSTRRCATWGETIEITPDSLLVLPEWQDWFDHYITATGANMENAKGPAWFLTSSYG